MCVFRCIYVCLLLYVCVICCWQVKRMRTENSWSQWCSYQLAADATLVAGLTLIPSKPSGILLHPSTPHYHHNPWDLLYWQLDWIRLQQPVSMMLLNGHFHSHAPLSCHSPWCCWVRLASPPFCDSHRHQKQDPSSSLDPALRPLWPKRVKKCSCVCVYVCVNVYVIITMASVAMRLMKRVKFFSNMKYLFLLNYYTYIVHCA